jgi:hypothetical protein
MSEVSTIGLDIAKSVFQIHGVDAAGAVVIRKRITRVRSPDWLKMKNSDAPAVKREEEEEWGKKKRR